MVGECGGRKTFQNVESDFEFLMADLKRPQT